MSKTLKTVFICNSQDGTILDGCNFIDKLSTKLQEQGIETTSIVTHFQEVKNYFGKKGLTCHFIADFPKKYPHKDVDSELSELEKKYETNLTRIMLGDFDQGDSDQKKALETMLSVFRFWEDLIEREKPDYIFGGGTRFLDMIAHAVCKKNKTRFLAFQIPIIPNTICFTEDILGHTSTLDSYWEKNKDKEITPSEKSTARDYIKAIIDSKERPFQIDSRPRLNLDKIQFFVDKAYRSFFIEKLRTPYTKPWRGAKNYGLRMVRSRLAKTVFEKPVEGEKYIFFPLHVECDAPILVWNPIFIDQSSLIKIISRNLPHNVKLYVKPHINDLGGTSIGKLKMMKQIPGVRLIDPSLDSYDLIKKSSAVFVIGGSAGWEGLLLKKPVIRAGNCFYDKLGMTWRGEDFGNLHQVMSNSLTKDIYDEEKLLRFIAALHKVCYPGKINFTQLFFANQSNRDFVLSDDNIDKVSLAIKKQLTEDFNLLSKKEDCS